MDRSEHNESIASSGHEKLDSVYESTNVDYYNYFNSYTQSQKYNHLFTQGNIEKVYKKRFNYRFICPMQFIHPGQYEQTSNQMSKT